MCEGAESIPPCVKLPLPSCQLLRSRDHTDRYHQSCSNVCGCVVCDAASADQPFLGIWGVWVWCACVCWYLPRKYVSSCAVLCLQDARRSMCVTLMCNVPGACSSRTNKRRCSADQARQSGGGWGSLLALGWSALVLLLSSAAAALRIPPGALNPVIAWKLDRFIIHLLLLFARPADDYMTVSFRRCYASCYPLWF